MRINEDIGEDSEDRLPFGSEEETVSKDEKVYEFVYSDCIYESGYMTISIHRTRDGAQKALEAHKEKVKTEWEEMYPDNEMGAFDAMKGWHVNETEILP